MLTINEKEEQLRATVAMPNVDDWELLIDRQEAMPIIAKANAILVKVLEESKAKAALFKPRGDIANFKLWAEIADAVFQPLEELENKFQVGLLDSEGTQTVARFFSVNFDPAIYNFLRFRGN